MKKIISLALVMCILFSCLSVQSQAANVKVIKTTEALEDGSILEIERTDSYIKTDLYDPDNKIVDSTYVDLLTKEVTITDNKKAVKKAKISDYAKEEKTKDFVAKDIKIKKNQDITFEDMVKSRSLISEPVDDAGLHDPYSDGYMYLGSDKVWYSSNIGYLFRKIQSMTKGEEYRFTFSKGTSVGTVVGVLLSVFTGTAIAAAVVMGLMATSAGLLTDIFSGKIDYRTYHYLYKVKVNNHDVFSTYRNIDYWYSKRDYTGEEKWVLKSFNSGFAPGNYDMIIAGIDATI